MMTKLVYQVSALAMTLAACGCMNFANYTPSAEPASPSPVAKQVDSWRPSSAAGVRIDQPPAGGTLWTQLVTGRSFSNRPDPYALHPKERAYETSQTTERVFSGTGFRVDFVPEEEKVVTPVIEPQPYRRLAGVIVGDSVLALIDMGDGQLQLIRPGQEIQGWRVVSIDSDKAVLRRSGNTLPHEITVHLESPPSGTPSTGGGAPGGGIPTPGGGGPPGTVGPSRGGGGAGGIEG